MKKVKQNIKNKVVKNKTITRFNTNYVQSQLLEINKKNGIECNAAIKLVVNNMILYNDLIKMYSEGDESKIFILYQLNGQIFKQLKEFNILPNIKNITNNDDDGF